MSEKDGADDCYDAIIAHLKKNGSGQNDWRALRKAYPNVGERRFFRMVKRAKDEPSVRGPLVTAALNAAERIRALNPTTAMSAAPPKPVAREATRAMDNIHLMETLRDLMVDAVLIREYSMTKPDEATGERGIKNPMFFAQSVKLRRELIETILKTWHEAFDLRRMQEFYGVILDEVGRASPEVQAAIMERLKIMSDERGFSFGGSQGVE